MEGTPEIPPLPPAPETGPPPGATGDSDAERSWAIAAHLSPLLGWIVGGWGLNLLGPLAIWMMRRKSGSFSEQQAREALNFQISLTIYGLVALITAGPVAILTLGLGLLALALLVMLVALASLVLGIVAAVTVSDGNSFRYPLTLRLVS